MTEGMMIARSIRFLGLCLIRAAMIVAYKPTNYYDAWDTAVRECGPVNIPDLKEINEHN